MRVTSSAHPAGLKRALGTPFFNPETFAPGPILTGTSIAALAYIGFDGISTLSEEVHNPRRNVLLATVLTCLITGVLAGAEVYVAQLVWPAYHDFPDVDTAFVHIAGRAGGVALLQLVNFSLLVASIGSGTGAQLGAARLRFGKEVAQPPAQDRDGAPATMLDDQQVGIRNGDNGLQAQQVHGRVPDKTVPRWPPAPAGPADLEGPGRAFDGHRRNY